MAQNFARLELICVFIFPVILQFSFSTALLSTPDFNSPYPKAISDLKDAIVKGLGFQGDDLKINGFDMRDALVGRSVAYEFDVEIDNKVMPFKLMEDVKRWEYVDLPIFRVEDPVRGGLDENGLVESRGRPDDVGKNVKEMAPIQFAGAVLWCFNAAGFCPLYPGRQKLIPSSSTLDDGLSVLAPFQLAGPMELWIQDAKDMRISLPHDVDAGVLKKVIIADGAVVTVTGARSVSLRHPIELPLPLNRTGNGFASGLLTLAERLRHASRTRSGQILSLRIVGPTYLTSPSSSSPSSNNKLKLKRLAPGLVELSSASKAKPVDALSTVDLRDAPTLLTPDQFTTLWPVTSINGSNSNLLGFETLLSSVLGSRASKKGSFKLLKADVSAQTYVKIGFGVEKKLKEGDGIEWEQYPEWRTKPENVKMHFEVLAKIDGDKVVAERVAQVNPIVQEDTVAPSVLAGNITMSKTPIVHPPSNPFTL